MLKGLCQGLTILGLLHISVPRAAAAKILIYFPPPKGVTAEQRESIARLVDQFSELVGDQLEGHESLEPVVVSPESVPSGLAIEELASREASVYYLTGKLWPPMENSVDLLWKAFKMSEQGTGKKIASKSLNLKLDAGINELEVDAATVGDLIIEGITNLSQPEIIFTWCFDCVTDDLRSRGLHILLAGSLAEHLKKLEKQGYRVTGLDPDSIRSICVDKTDPRMDEWESFRRQAEYVIGGLISKFGENRIAVTVKIRHRSGVEHPVNHKQRVGSEQDLPEALAERIQAKLNELVESP